MALQICLEGIALLLIILAKLTLISYTFTAILVCLLDKDLHKWFHKPKLNRRIRKTRAALCVIYTTAYKSLVLLFFMACRMVDLMSSPMIVFPVLNYLTCYFVLGFCLTGLVTALNHFAILYRHWLLEIDRERVINSTLFY